MEKRDGISNYNSAFNKLESFSRTEQRRRELFKPFRFDTAAHAVSDYTQTPTFRGIYLEANRYFSIPYADADLYTILGCFSGKVLQDVAEEYMSTFRYDVTVKDKSAQIVRLNSEQTLEIYKTLFFPKDPNSKVIKSAFDLDSLEGITVPDGMIVQMTPAQSPKVLAIYESSLRQRDEYYQRKFVAHSINANRHPGVLGDATVLFIPVQSENESPISLDFKFGAAAFHYLPFTREAFYAEMLSLVDDYRLTQDSATLAELQDRAREQNTRAALEVVSGNPSTDALRYIQNVGVTRSNQAVLFQSHRKVGALFVAPAA